MKKCPFCAEEIQNKAVKCKHCGSIIKKGDINKLAKKHPSFTMFMLLGILLPLVGFIVGIIYLCKSDAVERKLGEHTIGMSIVGSVFGMLLWYFLFNLINL